MDAHYFASYVKDLGHFWLGYIRMLGHPQIGPCKGGSCNPTSFIWKWDPGLIPDTLGTYCGYGHLVNEKCPTSFDKQMALCSLGSNEKDGQHLTKQIISFYKWSSLFWMQIVTSTFCLHVIPFCTLRVILFCCIPVNYEFQVKNEHFKMREGGIWHFCCNHTKSNIY